MSGGTKFDKGKAQLSLVPLAALEEEAKVFEFGAAKYGRDNYKAGMDYSRLIDAALRHINAFNSGEDLDPESGLSHLGHARCCLAMLLYYKAKGKGTDNRYKEMVVEAQKAVAPVKEPYVHIKNWPT